MSYCRWSSDNFMSDVYVYEDCYGGWTTHVAGNRLAFPPIPGFPLRWVSGLGQKWDAASRTVIYPDKWRKAAGSAYFWFYAKWEAVRSWMIGRIPRRRLPLPHAGKRYNDDTPGECADRLADLRAAGFNVPQYAIDSLREEQADLDRKAVALAECGPVLDLRTP